MKNTVLKYIAVNIALIIITDLAVLLLFHSGLNEVLLKTAVISGFTVAGLFLFMALNYFCYKKMKPENYTLLNIFWIIGSLVGIIGIVMTQINTYHRNKEKELLLLSIPLFTLLLLNVYIKNRIIGKREKAPGTQVTFTK